jgi:hypothetical protein
MKFQLNPMPKMGLGFVHLASGCGFETTLQVGLGLFYSRFYS